MHTNPDDLSALERQLAGCRPAANGLNADAMLFAAGQAASARPNPARWVWPAAACGLAIACIVLAGGWRSERTQRLELAARLSQPVDRAAAPISGSIPVAEPPSPGSYWSARRMIEKDDDAWTAQTSRSPGSPVELPKNPSTMRAWPVRSVEP